MLWLNRCCQVSNTTEPNGAATIQPWPHEYELRGKISRARTAIHVPIRPLGFKERASTDDAEPGAAIAAFAFGQLPHVAAHIITAEWGSAGRKSFHRRR